MKPTKPPPKERAIVSLRQVGVVTVVTSSFFAFTSPASQNSVLIILGIVSLGALLYAWCALFVRILASFWGIEKRQQRHLIVAISLTTLFLLLLQSIGQLSWRDVLAVLPFAAGLYAYSVYRSKGRAATS